MSYFDPVEHMDSAELADFEVRQHLWAQRRLAEADTVDTRAKVARMLAEVRPGPKVCGMFVTAGGVEGEKAKRAICGRAGVRMLALTGHWTCEEHDPLRRPGPPTCCVRAAVDEDGRPVIGLCADHAGSWECTAGIAGHGWAHRHTRLGG